MKKQLLVLSVLTVAFSLLAPGHGEHEAAHEVPTPKEQIDAFRNRQPTKVELDLLAERISKMPALEISEMAPARVSSEDLGIILEKLNQLPLTEKPKVFDKWFPIFKTFGKFDQFKKSYIDVLKSSTNAHDLLAGLQMIDPDFNVKSNSALAILAEATTTLQDHLAENKKSELDAIYKALIKSLLESFTLQDFNTAFADESSRKDWRHVAVMFDLFEDQALKEAGVTFAEKLINWINAQNEHSDSAAQALLTWIRIAVQKNKINDVIQRLDWSKITNLDLKIYEDWMLFFVKELKNENVAFPLINAYLNSAARSKTADAFNDALAFVQKNFSQVVLSHLTDFRSNLVSLLELLAKNGQVVDQQALAFLDKIAPGLAMKQKIALVAYSEPELKNPTLFAERIKNYSKEQLDYCIQILTDINNGKIKIKDASDMIFSFLAGVEAALSDVTSELETLQKKSRPLSQEDQENLTKLQQQNNNLTATKGKLINLITPWKWSLQKWAWVRRHFPKKAKYEPVFTTWDEARISKEIFNGMEGQLDPKAQGAIDTFIASFDAYYNVWKYFPASDPTLQPKNDWLKQQARARFKRYSDGWETLSREIRTAAVKRLETLDVSAQDCFFDLFSDARAQKNFSSDFATALLENERTAKKLSDQIFSASVAWIVQYSRGGFDGNLTDFPHELNNMTDQQFSGYMTAWYNHTALPTLDKFTAAALFDFSKITSQDRREKIVARLIAEGEDLKTKLTDAHEKERVDRLLNNLKVELPTTKISEVLKDTKKFKDWAKSLSDDYKKQLFTDPNFMNQLLPEQFDQVFKIMILPSTFMDAIKILPKITNTAIKPIVINNLLFVKRGFEEIQKKVQLNDDDSKILLAAIKELYDQALHDPQIQAMLNDNEFAKLVTDHFLVIMNDLDDHQFNALMDSWKTKNITVNDFVTLVNIVEEKISRITYESNDRKIKLRKRLYDYLQDFIKRKSLLSGPDHEKLSAIGPSLRTLFSRADFINALSNQEFEDFISWYGIILLPEQFEETSDIFSSIISTDRKVALFKAMQGYFVERPKQKEGVSRRDFDAYSIVLHAAGKTPALLAFFNNSDFIMLSADPNFVNYRVNDEEFKTFMKAWKEKIASLEINKTTRERFIQLVDSANQIMSEIKRDDHKKGLLDILNIYLERFRNPPDKKLTAEEIELYNEIEKKLKGLERELVPASA